MHKLKKNAEAKVIFLAKAGQSLFGCRTDLASNPFISMQQAKPRRPYWAGKAPAWGAEGQEDEELPAAAAAAAAAAAPPGRLAPTSAGFEAGPAAPVPADPRLQRLQEAVQRGRSAGEAVVVRRRPVPEPEEEDAGQAGVPLRHAEVGTAGGRQSADERHGVQTEAQDEEAIAARRLAIRARQAAAE